MKRILALSTAVVTMVVMALVSAGAVLAATIEGTPGNDTLIGTANTDTIYGRGGDDLIEAREARDILFGFGGDDVIVSGDDERADEVRCGTGYDIAYLSGPDHSVLTNNHQCEEIHTFSSFDVIVNPGGTAG